MRTLIQSVIAATLTLIPAAALAYPPQCQESCTCTSKCTDTCYIGWMSTTCGEADWRCRDNCAGAREDDAQARAEDTARSEEPAPICAEEPPATES